VPPILLGNLWAAGQVHVLPHAFQLTLTHNLTIPSSIIRTADNVFIEIAHKSSFLFIYLFYIYIYIYKGEELLALGQFSRRTTVYRLFAAAFSLYSQTASILEAVFWHHDVRRWGGRSPAY